MTTTTLTWTGTGVRESTACAVVRYHGATNTRGSRWIATIKRGADAPWRASLPYQEGPIAPRPPPRAFSCLPLAPRPSR
jgi:hypothetical protein